MQLKSNENYCVISYPSYHYLNIKQKIETTLIQRLACYEDPYVEKKNFPKSQVKTSLQVTNETEQP